MRKNGTSDDDLLNILAEVKLAYLATREGWDTINDWNDVFSGGEK
jgi:ATP-binding cassette, subfamily D (ALD), peroxisomal long-chain fatty acid import protein